MGDTPVALVTGATGDIGRSTYMALAQEGFRLILIGRDRSRLDRARRELDRSECEVRVLKMQGTVHEGEETRAIEEAVEALGGRLDVVVASSGGINHFGRWDHVPDAAWHEAFQENLLDNVALLRATVPLMQGKHPRIILISSFVATSPGKWNPHYSVAKAGQVHLVKHLASVLGERGFMVNSVSPAYTRTGGLVRSLRNSVPGASDQSEEFVSKRLEQMAERLPIGRLVEPQELAEVIRFLAVGPPVMSGLDLLVDAGMSTNRR